jgi:uncharacterized YigZ family protein
MSDLYCEPARESLTESKVQKSLFIAHVRICFNESHARETIKSISSEHRQANHNCWAYRVGAPKTDEYFSDDGEPAGTAGKPILGSLLRYDVTNTLIVVTRYFGGIKLGVRGLIEAYGSAATEGLNASGKVVKRVRKEYEINMPYDMAKLADRVLETFDTGADYRSCTYGADVTLRCAVPLDCTKQLEEILEEWRNSGRIALWSTINHQS